jgi:hypothetical protein
MAARLIYTGQLPSAGRRVNLPDITAEEVAEARRFFPRDKFFLYGHARSGTTLLTRLARLHPDVHCNYQAHFFSRSPLLQGLVADPDVGAWLSRRSNRWNHGRDLSPLVLRAAADFIMERDAPPDKRVVGDKSPNSLLNGEAVRLMHKVYPDARLVFIVRDGRDAAVSHRFQSFIENPDGLNAADAAIRSAFISDPQPFMSGQKSIFTEKSIRQAADGWVRNITETDREGKALYGGQYQALRYEDLLRQPWETMSAVWSFLGVDPLTPGLKETLESEMTRNPDADWQHEKAGEIARSLEKGKRGSWRELFTARDRTIFNHIAGETLTAWGYSLD